MLSNYDKFYVIKEEKLLSYRKIWKEKCYVPIKNNVDYVIADKDGSKQKW